MRTGSIYMIHNTVNDKVYIGQTTMTVHERFMVHMKPSTTKQKRTYKLYDAIAKYGRDKFYVETLETEIPLDLLNQKEIEYISKYDSFYNGYNSTKGGDGRVINTIDDEDELLHMAYEGKNSKEIASILHVHNATVLRTLHKLGFYYHVPQEEIIRLAESDMKNEDIARTLHCHHETVSRALNRHGKRKHRLPIKLRDDLDINELIDAYNNQVPIDELCNRFGITPTSFYRLKSKYKFKTRPQIYKHKIRYHAN